jgi:uncharacterized membrane protein YraQ (UPF0718 family)
LISYITSRFLDNRNTLYRFLFIAGSAILLLGTFWFASRYPSLLSKYEHIGQILPSMAYGKEIFKVTAGLPIWEKILYTTLNWLDGMKIGMSFGVMFGALIHTYLRYFPLTIGNNSFLNSLKGAIVGMPMGVCANCSVPVACGLTRGKGRIEVALGFLFSSPNFNPVVLMMSFFAFPLAMFLTKYVLLLAVILLVVPLFITYFEKNETLEIPSSQSFENEVCEIPLSQSQTFSEVIKGLIVEFGKNLWLLIKPTATIMVLSAILASVMLVLIPWNEILANTNPLMKLLVSILVTFMPVPIALDVMFAKQLLDKGVDSGYAMLFAMNLGTYSIIPSIYLWREVSRKLAVSLFVFFIVIGWIVSLVF